MVDKKQIIDEYIQEILYKTAPKKPDYIIHPLLHMSIGSVRPGLRVHMYGRPASGKTALAASLVVWASLNNQTVLWMDCSHSFPEEFLSNQVPVELQENVSVTREFTPESLAIFPTLYDLIIIDDTDSFMIQRKREIIPFASTCSKYGCTVVFISQVRRDIRQTKDLVPGTALTNADLTINTVRSEMMDEQTCRFRYTAMIKGYRGRFLHRNYSFEADYLGVDLMKLTFEMAVKANIVIKRGILLNYNGQNMGGIFEAARQNRFNYSLIQELHTKILEATDANRWVCDPSGEEDPGREDVSEVQTI